MSRQRVTVLFWPLFLLGASAWNPSAAAPQDRPEEPTAPVQFGTHGPYVSISWGLGYSDEGEPTDPAIFEFRIGTHIFPETRIDFVHYNEGELEEHHRDGFALQIVRRFPVTDWFVLEAGIGPYVSFDTTFDDRPQRNDTQLGVMLTGSMLFYLNDLLPGLHFRLTYDHASKPGSHDSHAFLVGLGWDFSLSPAEFSPEIDEAPFQVNAFPAYFKTNRSGTNHGWGGEVEVRKYLTRFLAFSAAYLEEAPDELVSRRGVPARLWGVLQIDAHWRVSAGGGPYFVRDRREHTYRVFGLISLEVERDIAWGLSAILRFSRIATREDTDRDIFELGIGFKF